MSTIRLALLGAAAVAALSAGNAHATPIPVCAGTTQTIVFCAFVDPGALPSVNPTGSSYSDCIVIPLNPCQPVTVPIPTVTPGTGDPVTTGCGGEIGKYMC